MKKVDDIGFWGAALLGVLLQPWGLVAAGGLKISQAHVGGPTKIVDYLLFGVLCTASILVMEGFALSAPEKAHERLGRVRAVARPAPQRHHHRPPGDRGGVADVPGRLRPGSTADRHHPTGPAAWTFRRQALK